jgi:hypothetical protein
VTLAGAEIGERHLVGAADLGIHVVNLASKAVGRKPFGHGVPIEKRLVDFLGRRTENSVQSDSIACHDFFSFHSPVRFRLSSL